MTLSSPTILLAASVDQIRLVSGLRNSGYRLVFKSSGADTLSYLRENTPDLMLLSDDLPDLSGIEICYRVKKVSRLKTTPVMLLIQRLNSQRQEIEATMAKADRVTHLPISQRDLEDAVRQLLYHSGAPLPNALPSQVAA